MMGMNRVVSGFDVKILEARTVVSKPLITLIFRMYTRQYDRDKWTQPWSLRNHVA